jgi:hypothetical protein
VSQPYDQLPGPKGAAGQRLQLTVGREPRLKGHLGKLGSLLVPRQMVEGVAVIEDPQVLLDRARHLRLRVRVTPPSTRAQVLTILPVFSSIRTTVPGIP